MSERTTGPQEEAAMVEAELATPPTTPPERFRQGWLAAHDYLTGKGYTPRSMLRMQAAQEGRCRICGSPWPAAPPSHEEQG